MDTNTHVKSEVESEESEDESARSDGDDEAKPLICPLCMWIGDRCRVEAASSAKTPFDPVLVFTCDPCGSLMLLK